MKRADKNFEWKEFSVKQKKVLTWWTNASPYKDYVGIICDGSVRSGKTISMGIAFVLWSMSTFNGEDFALCGKTIGALRRNVINKLKQQCLSIGYDWQENRSDGLIAISNGNVTNYYYLFGGKDEASQDNIQGATLAGCYFDEVALMPRSFVLQAEARCSVTGAKLWYNCNPKSPQHYIKTDYIDDAVNRKLYHIHFLMDDNLTLSEERREFYRTQYKGVFYSRYILGQWVTAEGRIYLDFDKSAHTIPADEWYHKGADGNYDHPLRSEVLIATVGVDFGGNGSATAFNLSLITKGFNKVITAKERYYKKELTPAELNKHFIDFIKECKAEYPNLVEVYCDSAEQILINGFKHEIVKNGLGISIKNAKKGEIIDRIRFYTTLHGQNRHLIVSNCTHTIEAFETAVWETDKNEKPLLDDKRLDDGSTNIDNLDAQEYSTEPYMKAILQLE